MAWRAVIFDMDGLMLDTERISREAWRAAALEVGLPYREDWLVHIVGRSMGDIGRVLAGLGGPDFPVDIYMRVADRYYLDAIEHGQIPVKDGLWELLDWLEGQGIPRVVATSTHGPTAAHKLAVTGLRDRFHGVMTGDRVERGKPSPDIFVAAAALLGVDACDCVVLEDSENGIRGAHAAGAFPILVPDFLPPSDEVRGLAGQIFPDLHAATTWLQAEERFRLG